MAQKYTTKRQQQIRLPPLAPKYQQVNVFEERKNVESLHLYNKYPYNADSFSRNFHSPKSSSTYASLMTSQPHMISQTSQSQQPLQPLQPAFTTFITFAIFLSFAITPSF